MPDQACDLRRLAEERAAPWGLRAAGRPALVAVMGGKGGVGTTTVAVELAIALAKSGKRTLLIDADPRGGDAALRCGIDERHTLADLLAGRRTWNEVLATGSDGIRIVAGARWSDEVGVGLSPAERLLELLDDARPYADAAVIDVGNSLGRAGQRICQRAEAIVMVTTSDATSVVSTFAAIKVLARSACISDGTDGDEPVLPLYLWVNMAPRLRDAEAVRDRLGWACRRLLGMERVGYMPRDLGRLLQAAERVGNGNPSYTVAQVYRP